MTLTWRHQKDRHTKDCPLSWEYCQIFFYFFTQIAITKTIKLSIWMWLLTVHNL